MNCDVRPYTIDVAKLQELKCTVNGIAMCTGGLEESQMNVAHKIGQHNIELRLLPDTGGVALDSHAAVRDPGKMHERSNLTNGGLLHRCELIKKIPKLPCPQIHVWIKTFAGRPSTRIRDVSENGYYAVS